MDTPYKYGGNSNSGIDCSAFTQNVMSHSIKLNLPRTAREQYLSGEYVENITELKFGDLVFFDTSKKVYPGHVGIFLGDNLFVHASQSRGVIISAVEEEYYKTRFVGGRRIDINQ
jgi:cell wall-associated NlpC family hydrolase